MDILKRRFDINENYDLYYENQKKNTKELARFCMKNCGNFKSNELNQEEMQCLKNCHKIILRPLLRNMLYE